MQRRSRSALALPALAAAAAAALGFALPVSAAAGQPTVVHVGQIDRQDVAPQPGCEQDTLVEPSVAVSPLNPAISVAAAHDCRYANGGAVDISYAWTHDGGAHWQHAPLPLLTEAVGGVWDRASDPVVSFGPDGSVYIAALVFDARTCPTGVTVSRSTDGGATFAAPVVVQRSATCAYSDDKDWLVVDTESHSPHLGRLYVFWTAFLSDAKGNTTGIPQVVRWSDDHGVSWSSTHLVTSTRDQTQNSQPMVQPNGTLVDVYEHYTATTPLTSDGALESRVSQDGGATWGPPSQVVANTSAGPPHIRCCLNAAADDPVSGRLYAVWESNAVGEPLRLSSSSDGVHWSAPRTVTPGAGRASIQHVNMAVTAYSGNVLVSYGVRDTAVDAGRFVQQQVVYSGDAGSSFGSPLALGPPSDLRYAARAGGEFPGDYIGISEVGRNVTAVWCVSSKPANSSLSFNQTLYAASLLTP